MPVFDAISRKAQLQPNYFVLQYHPQHIEDQSILVGVLHSTPSRLT